MSDWPVSLSGVTETIVTSRGPGGRWNAAALGVKAGSPPTARTWGDTRTRRNFERRGEGVVQFTGDVLRFVEAALTIVEVEEPVLPCAGAWARVTVERRASGESGGTEWVEWGLEPTEQAICERTVPTLDRATGAVLEASVAASRLSVPTYDTEVLHDRIDRCADVVERTGGEREQRAMAMIDDHRGEDNGGN